MGARQGRRCRDRSLRKGVILANGCARATNRQRRPLAREPSRLRPQRGAGAGIVAERRSAEPARSHWQIPALAGVLFSYPHFGLS